MGTTYHQRPSTILGLTDSWTAYQLDLCVLSFGTWVENLLAERTKKGKAKYSLRGVLSRAKANVARARGDEAEERRHYAPASASLSARRGGIRRVRIDESGIW